MNIPNYLEKLDDSILVCNVSRILQESHGKSGLTFSQASEKIGVSRKYYYELLNSRRAASISFLRLFARDVDGAVFEKIYALSELFLTARVNRVKMPKEITSDLAYFFGYLQGDGCLTSDKKGLTFSDEYLDQITAMNNLSRKIFGIEGKIYEKISAIAIKPAYHLEIKNVVLNSFFHHVFGLNRGKKEKMTIPDFIKSNQAFARSYLSGLFDADGTLPKNPEKAKMLFIDIAMKDKQFILDIQNLISTFDINTLKMYERDSSSSITLKKCKTYELRIRRIIELTKFLQRVGFLHPNKAIRAQKMLQVLSKRPGSSAWIERFTPKEEVVGSSPTRVV